MTDIVNTVQYCRALIKVISKIEIREQGGGMLFDCSAWRTEGNQYGVFEWFVEPGEVDGEFVHHQSGAKGTVDMLLCDFANVYALDLMEPVLEQQTFDN